MNEKNKHRGVTTIPVLIFLIGSVIMGLGMNTYSTSIFQSNAEQKSMAIQNVKIWVSPNDDVGIAWGAAGIRNNGDTILSFDTIQVRGSSVPYVNWYVDNNQSDVTISNFQAQYSITSITPSGSLTDSNTLSNLCLTSQNMIRIDFDGVGSKPTLCLQQANGPITLKPGDRMIIYFRIPDGVISSLDAGSTSNIAIYAGMVGSSVNSGIQVTPNQSPYPISLMFVQYPSPEDAPTVHSLMLQYLTSPTDFIQIQSNNYYLDFPNQRKLMVADSLNAIDGRISSAKTIGVPVYAISYDFEHWSATPDSEQADPLGSMSEAADTVHGAGYKFAFAPDSKYLNDLYKQYDWSKVDVAWLQVGYNARTNSTYVPFITDVINTIRTENPNTTIIVQLSLVVMSDSSFSDPVSQYDAEVDTVAKLKVDTITVVYLDPSKSPNFTIPNLEKILAHIATLRQ